MSWSENRQAYAAAEQNLLSARRETLIGAYAEWKAYLCAGGSVTFPPAYIHTHFDELAYTNAVSDAAQMERRELVDEILRWSAEWAECDGGGVNAHICPFGCHTISLGG